MHKYQSSAFYNLETLLITRTHSFPR